MVCFCREIKEDITGERIVKRRIDDKEVLDLLDKMYIGNMTLEERTKLHTAVSNKYRRTRLASLFECARSLMLYMAMIVCAGVYAYATGENMNKVLFHVGMYVVPLLCVFMVVFIFEKVQIWMDKPDIVDESIEEELLKNE